MFRFQEIFSHSMLVIGLSLGSAIVFLEACDKPPTRPALEVNKPPRAGTQEVIKPKDMGYTPSNPMGDQRPVQTNPSPSAPSAPSAPPTSPVSIGEQPKVTPTGEVKPATPAPTVPAVTPKPPDPVNEDPSPVQTAELKVGFTLLSNAEDGSSYKAVIVLENLSKVALKNWNLHFNFVRPITSVGNAELILNKDRTGDYFVLKGDATRADLAAGQKLEIALAGKWGLKHDTDSPAGFFVAFDGQGGKRHIVDINSTAKILPDWKPAAGEDEASREAKYVQTAVEGNAVGVVRKPEFIIPAPVSFTAGSSPGFEINPQTQLFASTAEGLAAARFFADSIKLPATQAVQGVPETVPANSIVFLVDGTLATEGYSLSSDQKQVMIKAKDAAGFHYAIQSLRQLLPATVYSQALAAGGKWTLPSVTIKDYPRFPYRGLNLDTGRHFRPIEDVKRLIDLMAVHKLNSFHWHLTDDEGWRIEIKKYPQLTKIGAWRGYGLPMAPALGSGSKSYGGFYTQVEIKELVQYAKERQITIIPEIDLPGHARAMLKSLPDLLVDKDDKSVYESVQGYNDNVLSPCIESTFEVIDSVLGEVALLFPHNIIHVGSDEVPEGVWDAEKSPNCKKLAAKENLKGKAQLEHYFITRVKTIAEKHGKKIAGWEEIALGSGFPNKDVLVYAWQTKNVGLDLLKAGYEVIFTPANFLYFDLAYNESAREPGYYWAKTIDTFKTYSYTPVPAGLTAAEISRVKGIQGCLWSELIKTKDDVDYRAFPRTAALAEVAWSPATRRDWKDFSDRLINNHLQRLAQYGVKYRKPITAK